MHSMSSVPYVGAIIRILIIMYFWSRTPSPNHEGGRLECLTDSNAVSGLGFVAGIRLETMLFFLVYNGAEILELQIC